jgi:hypothetical protein
LVSTDFFDVQFSADSKPITPNTINRSIHSFTIPANTTLNFALTGAANVNFYGVLNIFVDKGKGGFAKVNISGNTSGAKYNNQSSSYAAGYSTTIGQGANGQLLSFSFANTGVTATPIVLDYTSESGLYTYWV